MGPEPAFGVPDGGARVSDVGGGFGDALARAARRVRGFVRLGTVALTVICGRTVCAVRGPRC
jgi:hypothetical protein